ncbi:AsnC family transcriptional regulator [Pandoraea terrae]|uniref:AsnC family transcriptional regulator n=1 Tax=Pandoraea terrae TaxID=1537710 RepID=A0A5E4UL40_9BURK|nr:Lrp/AsnC family transcriptional regulator [Pandoraea terrae]VVE00677.1 AsnC family transcriptional regulator [Pandoraea terrae]
MQLDLADLRILRHMEQNGRITNQELADAVGLSPSACLRRVKLLEERGVIAGYRCIVDPQHIGLEFEALVQITLRPDVEGWHEKFLEALQNWPEVIEARIVTGGANYMLTVRARNLAHYSDFIINELYQAPAVMSIHSNIVLKTIKRDNSLLDLVKKTS